MFTDQETNLEQLVTGECSAEETQFWMRHQILPNLHRKRGSWEKILAQVLFRRELLSGRMEQSTG